MRGVLIATGFVVAVVGFWLARRRRRDREDRAPLSQGWLVQNEKHGDRRRAGMEAKGTVAKTNEQDSPAGGD